MNVTGASSDLRWCPECKENKVAKFIKNAVTKLDSVCKDCYEKTLAEKHNREGKQCFFCGITKARKWYKIDKWKDKVYQCNSCYYKYRQIIKNNKKFCIDPLPGVVLDENIPPLFDFVIIPPPEKWNGIKFTS